MSITIPEGVKMLTIFGLGTILNILTGFKPGGFWRKWGIVPTSIQLGNLYVSEFKANLHESNVVIVIHINFGGEQWVSEAHYGPNK